MSADPPTIHHSSFSDHRYPRRLIEVDLPIKRISAHARREKSIRHGHISTLHIWWARRPLAACRAVICAALWPDPADALCPDSFRETARMWMRKWAEKHSQLLGPESHKRFVDIQKHPERLNDNAVVRQALLDFIADFANWDNSTKKEYLDTSRVLTAYAHRSLAEADFKPSANEINESIRNPESAIRNWPRPLVVDPFAGGGSIPLEALRVGADAFASDLNPVAVLLNKVVLEYIPKYGQRLADEVRQWGEWIKCEAEKELAEFYPKDPDGATPIAYLWARTIRCEGPGCGAEVPLIRSLWLAKKANRSVALQLVPRPRAKRVDFQIIVKQRGGWADQDGPKTKIEDPKFDGTVKRGSATCPCCGYTTPVARVREQLKRRRGGATDARLMCIVTTRTGEQGRFYRLPTELDLRGIRKASVELQKRQKAHTGRLSLVPDEKLDLRGIRHTWAMIYGLERWGDLFMPRQALMLTTLFKLLDEVERKSKNGELSLPLQVSLALAIDRQANASTSLSRWHTSGEKLEGLFARQAIPMLWDYAESAPFCDSSGSFDGAVEWVAKVCEANVLGTAAGQAEAASAASHPLADDFAHGFITDPPYYDAVPYAYLSDFFYVWLRRCLSRVLPELFAHASVPKDAEIVVDRPHELSDSTHDIAFYERELTKAFAEGRRVLRPDGVGTVVFASKTTASWEAILKAVVDAGWIITGSWPIDTEMEARVSAQGQARLASSVHLVCRPRENPDGSVRTDEVGDWRDVLAELPRRIHDWMPRLAEEGVVGADAIFACLGPALEIFSRYSRVEKASGEKVELREYLEQVWAAVAREALSMIFAGADASGFEEDARLTAMWLWTLGTNGERGRMNDELGAEDEEEGEGTRNGKGKVAGFALEYDAARKIAQGLGAHLEALTSLVEVKGDTARLLPVAERTKSLFGTDDTSTPSAKRKKKDPQLKLGFEKELEQAEESGGWGQKDARRRGAPRQGETVLDRIHQAMILFGAGRSEALRRFLVDDGAGRDERFWRLAQALSALYPPRTDEKRWVDGVLARKKGLGL
jgi:adenine-specific DNA methylase